ncbi:hypothetical protein BKA83DRAFT_4126668 [Pisolithus microcarpus]|nr:hypothetical protein BKA83DRAFT_4126668 [Pisolithus microcarpus]
MLAPFTIVAVVGCLAPFTPFATGHVYYLFWITKAMWLSTAPVSARVFLPPPPSSHSSVAYRLVKPPISMGEYLGDLCDLYDSDKRSHPLIRPKLRIFHCFLGVPQQLILVRFFGFFGPFLVIFFGKGVLILVRIFGFLGPFLVIFFSQSSLILIRIFGFLGPFLAIFFSQGALILVRIFCLLAPFLIIFLGWGTLCIFRIFGLLGYILGHNFVQCALTSAHICVQIIWDFVSIDILPFPLSFVLQTCGSTPPTSPQHAHNAARQAECDQHVLGSPPSCHQPHVPVHAIPAPIIAHPPVPVQQYPGIPPPPQPHLPMMMPFPPPYPQPALGYQIFAPPPAPPQNIPQCVDYTAQLLEGFNSDHGRRCQQRHNQRTNNLSTPVPAQPGPSHVPPPPDYHTYQQVNNWQHEAEQWRHQQAQQEHAQNVQAIQVQQLQEWGHLQSMRVQQQQEQGQEWQHIQNMRIQQGQEQGQERQHQQFIRVQQQQRQEQEWQHKHFIRGAAATEAGAGTATPSVH